MALAIRRLMSARLRQAIGQSTSDLAGDAIAPIMERYLPTVAKNFFGRDLGFGPRPGGTGLHKTVGSR